MSCSALTLLTTCFECKQVTVMALIISVNVSCSDIKLRADMHTMPPCRVEALTGVGLLLPATPLLLLLLLIGTLPRRLPLIQRPRRLTRQALALHTILLHCTSFAAPCAFPWMAEQQSWVSCTCKSGAALHHHGDTHCGIQVGGALQQTDQWVFWSHAGFTGPVTKAELCHSFQTGDLEGEMLVHHVSEHFPAAKEMAEYYEQWGLHMPGVPPTGCMQDDQALSQKVTCAL